MNRDSYIFIAFCVFMLLVGMRWRQRWKEARKKKTEAGVPKNQRPKVAAAGEPEEVRVRRLRREKRVRLFTIVQLVVLFGLLVFMIPALVKDIADPGGIVWQNFVLRALIFLFAIYVFTIGYIKIFRKKSEDREER
ncbi:MAG: hypothetical protein LBR65_07445 [Culturomica sp.]|jgi:uncharacterized BrkB/YihY/UPF0761 family membrane protein|nr:hypothetical protein [Culturomica sp.]